MNDEQTRERRVIGILAAGDAAAIDRYFLSLDDIPEWRFLRPPETGLVMMRGRIGGDGEIAAGDQLAACGTGKPLDFRNDRFGVAHD